MNSNIPGVNPDSSLPGFTFIVSNISRIQGLVLKYVLFTRLDILISPLPRLTFPTWSKEVFYNTQDIYSPTPPPRL